MTAIRDLDKMLAELTVARRPGVWTLVSVDEPVSLSGDIAALITEAEGTTAIVTVTEAERRGWSYDFRAAWLTLEIHSALEGVGLTAAVSKALAEINLPCNVLAGYYHDHLLVPVDRVDDAIAAIEALRPS